MYYFRKGFGDGSRNWVIYLGGGGFCYSVSDCNARKISDPELMTSTDKPASFSVNGILSTSRLDNPDFYNANHVAVPYCSSDLWSGNREKSEATGGHEFRGRRIVRAIIQDLKNGETGVDLSSATRVLFAGTSAGGVGVMVHADWIRTQLPSADVRGVNDGGWTPDLLPNFPGNLFQRINVALQLWNGKVDASCARANSGSEYRCYTSSAYPFVQTPLLIQMSQYDTVYLGAIGVHAPFDSQEQFVANLFSSAIRDSLKPVAAAFSPKAHSHGLMHSRKFFTVKIQTQSLQDVIGNWFFDRPGPVKLIQ